MVRSLDTIQVHRGRTDASWPAPRSAEAPVGRRSSSATSGAIMAVLLIAGSFFLATQPSADTPTSAETTESVKSTPSTPTTTVPDEVGPPQPDEGQALEQAVILDRPLATSQRQDGSSGSLGQSATQPSSVTPDSFTIRILNGSGQSGAATAEQTTLKQSGFQVTEVGTAVNRYSTTVIYYTADHRAQAAAVQQALNRSVTLKEDPIAQPADVLLVIGDDL